MAEPNGTSDPTQMPLLYQSAERSLAQRAMPLRVNGEPSVPRRDLIQYWNIVRRWWWVILLFTLACVTAASLIALSSPRVYSSSATILISSKPQAKLSLVEAAGGMDSASSELNTEVVLLRSAPVIQIAADLLAEMAKKQPGIIEPGRRISTTEIASSISATNLTDTNLVNISAEAGSAELAAAMANAVAKAFAQYQTEQATSADNETLKFLGKELLNASTKLDKSEQDLQAFEQRAGIISTSGFVNSSSSSDSNATPDTGVEARLQITEANLASSLQQQAVIEQRIADLKRELGAAASLIRDQHAGAIRDNVLTQTLRAQLDAKQRELADASARLTPAGIERWHPGLVASVARLQKELQQQIGNIASGKSMDLTAQQTYNQALQAAEMDLHAQQIQVADLKRSAAALRSQVAAQPAINTQLGQLLRQRNILQSAYTNLLERQKQVEISMAAVQGNATVVSLGTVPTIPIRPNRKRDALLGLFLGLVLGCGAAWGLDYLDNSVRTWADVKDRVGLPLLGVIPTAAVLPRELWSASSRSMSAEAFRMLRSNVSFVNVDEPVKTILVTSAGPGEGKSSTVANLASAMAQDGRRVIIVDADMRKPSQFRLVGGGRKNGLAEFLSGSVTLEETVRPSEIANVWTIPVDKLPPNPAELLSSHRMRDLLLLLRDDYDIVFIDSPPCLMVTDANLLTGMADATIQVISSGKTSQQAALRARDSLTASHGRVVGAVLNRMSERDDSNYYYYYYYYGENGETGKRGLFQRLFGVKNS